MTLESSTGPTDALVVERRGSLERRPVPRWAERLVRALDDAIRVPGTGLGIGLDGVIGFILPGAGDALTAVGSLAILYLAWQKGVPRSVLVRMVANIAIDALLGSLPVLGDAFDVLWKSNRMNLELLRRFESEPERRRSAADYAVVAAAVIFVIGSVLLPIALLALLVATFSRHF